MRKITTIVILVSTVLFSCRKEKTVWNSDWRIPLVSDSLNLSHYINDSTLSVGSSGFIEVDLTRTVLDLGMDDFLELPDTVIEQSFMSSIGPLNLPPGFTIVNQVEEHKFNLKDVELKKIRLKTGEINFTVFNPVQTTCSFSIKLPGVTKNGIDLEHQFFVPASIGKTPGSMNLTIDLSGYEIDLTGINGSTHNILQSLLSVSSDPTGPSVTLTTSDEFKFHASFRNLHLDYALGYFGKKVISGSTLLNLELFRKVISGKIDIPAPDLQIRLINGVKVKAKVTILSLSNTNASQQQEILAGTNIGLPVDLIEPTVNGLSLLPSLTTMEFNATNSSIENYFENLGVSHKLDYKLELNPLGNVSGADNEILPNSRLKVQVHAKMPLSIGLDGLTLQDTFDLNLSQNREKSHFSSGSLMLNASNTFPFEAGVTLFFLDQGGNLLYTLVNSQKVESGTSGSLDLSSGLYKKDSELSFMLSESMIKDLSTIKKVVVRARFNSPNSSVINVQAAIEAGSFLAIKLKTRFMLNTRF
jgi:hypothetical protein